MKLSVELDGQTAKLMRGKVQIGTFELDDDLELRKITISSAANRDEEEKVIRLAASHVTQYRIKPRRARASGATMVEDIQPAIPNLRRNDSVRLLDFTQTLKQHAGMHVSQLEALLRGSNVPVKRMP